MTSGFAQVGQTEKTSAFMLLSSVVRADRFLMSKRNKHNPEQQIREQRYDVGALGYGGNRVVEVKPFTRLFWKVTPVDTTKINKADWIRVDKEGDVKFP